MTTVADGVAAPRVVDVAGVPMSALVRQVSEPRAVIVALHGGAASARYFHHPGPRLSLLDTAAALGFTVLALDRPGYGRCAPHESALGSADFRVDLAYGTVDQLLGAAPRGAGLFLLAHSAGSELAVRMAADAARGPDLLGVELAGTGRHWHAEASAILSATRSNAAEPRRPGGLQRILWQPEHLYPAEALGGRRFASPSPAYEAAVLAEWAPREFARTAAKVTVPVHYTLGEHDLVWRTDPEAMADVAGLFSASPRVVSTVQAGGGHNLSVGLTALAYHLAVLSFVEECVVAREQRTDRR
jgi:pimeloyl-ACP methyl ester carboxylesterase